MFDSARSGEKNCHRFAAPEDILVDRNLAGGERRRLLEEWKLELELAAEKPAKPQPKRWTQAPEELLRRVNACRRLLSEEE